MVLGWLLLVWELQLGSNKEVVGRPRDKLCMASSATVVEIKAGLILMEWAIKEKLRGICISSSLPSTIHYKREPIRCRKQRPI